MKSILVILIAVSLVLAVAGFALAKPEIEGKDVKYSADGVVMNGYLAYDKHISRKRP